MNYIEGVERNEKMHLHQAPYSSALNSLNPSRANAAIRDYFVCLVVGLLSRMELKMPISLRKQDASLTQI